MILLDEVVSYILVVDELHENKLSVCALRMRHILEWSTQLLDGNILSCHCVVGCTVNDINTTLLWSVQHRDYCNANNYADSTGCITKYIVQKWICTERKYLHFN